MKVFKGLPGLLLAVIVFAGVALAAEQDYTWTISGELKGDADTNLVYLGVTSDSLLRAATVEVHYDTTLLEFVPYDNAADYLTGRTTVFAQAPMPGADADFVRILLFDLSMDIPPGSGNVLKLRFRVKAGVAGGTMAAFRLTRRNGNTSGAELATQQMEIEGSLWDNPGDPRDFTWKIKGLAVVDSSTVEANLILTNTVWVADMVLNLVYDPAVFEIADLSTDVTLLGRAADINLDVVSASGSGMATLTFSSTSSIPPFPVIDPGSGKIVNIKFTAVNALADGETTEITLKHSDGTELVAYQLPARAYSGPSADTDGNGSTNIFDVLTFLTLWQNSPANPFTDVNGDGKSDIFDLLEILKAMR